MDMKKMGNRTWSEPGLHPLSTSAVGNFQADAVEAKLTNSVGDLLNLTRERASRKFVGDSEPKNVRSLSKKGSTSGNAVKTNLLTKSSHATYQNVHERPPRRVEISYLENELTQMVKTVMQPESDDVIYQPHKEKMMLVRNRVIDELGIEHDDAHREPWIESVVKSECLKDLCDEVGLRLTDMLSVSSAELGNVLRKLRYTYDQSFLQVLSSWKDVRSRYVTVDNDLSEAQEYVQSLREQLDERDFNIREQIDSEVDEIKKDFEFEREKDKEKIRMHEQQMDQMNTTLKNLNAIFKTMQSDVDAARSADTFARCSRLEREVSELESQVASAERVKKELDEEREKSTSLEQTRDTLRSEIEGLKSELGRRDATIAELMEREKERNAEIEKLTRMAAQRQENDDDLDLDPVASSVLCIKCKKALDDISSIREAILGRSGDGGKRQKLACEAYRILLPNNRGKKPYRSNSWLKACMRSILTSKMTETLTLLPIGEHVSPLPSFVYAWFDPPQERIAMDSHAVQSLQHQTDENRWGFYYGVKTLAKDNAEAKLFWGLLDEAQGNDGLIFVVHCLSVVLSIGGPQLWGQFKETMNHSCLTPQSEEMFDRAHPSTIWLELDTAVAAVRLIFVRALESQILDTLDAIESLKCVPSVDEAENDGDEEGKTPDDENDVEAVESANDIVEGQPKEPTCTHIDLFIWLRVMMERFQDEQCHRQAAIRLMFDTASMGALTGSSNSPRQSSIAEGQYDSDNPQVFFPQFSAVVKTLYPHMSLAETAELYSASYKLGDGKVTADVFCELAEMRHLFSKSLKLGPLPLLNHKIANEQDFESSTPRDNGVNIDTDQATTIRSQLGSLVHQRFALLYPEIEKISLNLPNKWKGLVTDACENVRSALNEYFISMKTKKRNVAAVGNTGTITTTDGSMVSSGTKRAGSDVHGRYVDGLQPFIQYHRLLSIVLVVRSFSENSLLPTTFIVDNTQTMTFGDSDEVTIAVNSISVKKVDTVLSSMETAIFCHSHKVDNRNRYERFQHCRRSYYARKMQIAFRNFVNKDSVIPVGLRFNLRPGYLTGSKEHYGRSLKFRRVFMEPWAAQSLVANVYALKLSYDVRAHTSGYEQIKLSNATASLLLAMFSDVSVSERAMQDLCLAIQTYMHGSPRLRMFACFLGFGEMDEPIATLFKTDAMLLAYIDLVMSIHKEVLALDENSDSFISSLFPCTEDPSARTDKRDLWILDIGVLTKALARWAAGVSGIKEGTWENALTRVKRSNDGLAEVDDFLWVMMQVLAKDLSSKLRKCDDKAKAHTSKEGSQTAKKPMDLQRTSSTILAEHNAEDKKMAAMLFPHSANVYVLQSAVENIRVRTGKSSDGDASGMEADMQRCCSVFISNYSSERSCNYHMYSKMLKDCILWDTMTASRYDPDNAERDDEASLRSVSKFGDLKDGGRSSKHISVRSGVPPALSLRFYQHWWNMNRDCIADEITLLETSDHAADEDPIKLSAESETLLNEANRCRFRLDQIFAENDSLISAPGAVSSTDANLLLADMEVWELVGTMAGSLSQCLKSVGRSFPRDNWKAGRKLHLDRAVAYLMQVQSNIS